MKHETKVVLQEVVKRLRNINSVNSRLPGYVRSELTDIRVLVDLVIEKEEESDTSKV